MKQGQFLSSESPVSLVSNAAQDGAHELRVYIPLGGVLTCPFTGSIGVPFAVENIFPEIGTYKIDIVQPDGSFFDDGSGCYLWVEVFAHCGADSC